MMCGNKRGSGTVALAAGLLMLLLGGTGAQGAKPKITFKIPYDATNLAISADDKLTAAAGDGSSESPPLTVWDNATGKRIANLNDPKRKFYDILAVTFSPDGKLLGAVARHDVSALLRVWDTKTWRLVERFEEKEARCERCLAFSPNGRWLANGQLQLSDRTKPGANLLLWDIKTGQRRSILYLDGSVGYPVFSPDSRYLACFGLRGIVIWDLHTFKRKHTIWTAEGETWKGCLKFSPDGKTFLAVEGNKIRIYDIPTWREKKRIQIGPIVWDVTFLPNSKRLAVAAEVGDVFSVVLVDYESGRKLKTVAYHKKELPYRTKFYLVHGRTHEMKLSATGKTLYLLRNDDLFIWDISKLTELERTKCPAPADHSFQRCKILSRRCKLWRRISR